MPRTRSVAWAQLKLGVVGILAAVLVTIVVVAIGGAGGFPWERYPLKTQFPDAAGLKSGAVVRLSGKDVGTVSSVEFAGANIEVTFEVSEDVRPLITTESLATVGSLSLLGEAMLDIQASTHGRPLPDWGYVPSTTAGGLGDLTTSATATLAEAQQLVANISAGRGTVGKLFTDDAVYQHLDELLTAASDVAERIRAGRGTLGALTTDSGAYTALQASLQNLQGITAQIQRGQGALGRLLYDEALGRSLANTTANLSNVTDRLQKGEGTLGRLMTDTQLYDRLNAMAGRIEQIVTNLESGQGTAGRLLRDQTLYENMNRTVVELRELFAEVRKDPRKYLRLSVSIF